MLKSKQVPGAVAKPVPPDQVDDLYQRLKLLDVELPCKAWPTTVSREFAESLRNAGYIHSQGNGFTLAPKAYEYISAHEMHLGEEAKKVSKRSEDKRLQDENERKRNIREWRRFALTIVWGLLVALVSYVLSVLSSVDTPFRRWLLALFHQKILSP
ncbi:hypothetical protein AGMMS49992_29330 [Clostridia bacterium]|nr:hypothetical protein AGMMS49992_29330 [Clostridia bacterium]